MVWLFDLEQAVRQDVLVEATRDLVLIEEHVVVRVRLADYILFPNVKVLCVNQVQRLSTLLRRLIQILWVDWVLHPLEVKSGLGNVNAIESELGLDQSTGSGNLPVKVHNKVAGSLLVCIKCVS
jgi:hypothetical protein